MQTSLASQRVALTKMDRVLHVARKKQPRELALPELATIRRRLLRPAIGGQLGYWVKLRSLVSTSSSASITRRPVCSGTWWSFPTRAILLNHPPPFFCRLSSFTPAKPQRPLGRDIVRER